jgi:hypothetical protein
VQNKLIIHTRMTPSIPEVCVEGNVVTITAAGDNMVDDLLNENFQFRLVV